MSTIEQLPEKIDSNLTIVPPAKIEITYLVNVGWYILIDGKPVNCSEPEHSSKVRYFDDVAEPMQYLDDRHLIKTKAYREFDKMIKKVHNKNSKSKRLKS